MRILGKLASILMILFLVNTFVSCEKKEAPKAQGVPVQITTLEEGPVEVSTDYIGVLNTKYSTNIYPRISGPVEKILVKDGSDVEKGQAILSIEHSEQSAATSSSIAMAHSNKEQVSISKADFSAAQADLEAAKAQLKLAKIQYDRYKTLFETGSATQSDFDTYTNEYEQAKASLRSAEENLRAKKQSITASESTYKKYQDDAKQQQSILDYYTIRAPFSGRISIVNPSIGQYITPQDLITILDAGNLLDVEVGVDLKYKKQLRKGLTLKVLDKDNNPIKSGKIWFIAPSVDSNDQTIMVKATINNEDKIFNDAQIVKVKLVWDTTQGITVPTPSVVMFAGQHYVYTVGTQNGQKIAQQVPVKFGTLLGQYIEITDGLKAGDILIVSGVQKLRNNTPITILTNQPVKKDKES